MYGTGSCNLLKMAGTVSRQDQVESLNNLFGSQSGKDGLVLCAWDFRLCPARKDFVLS